MDFFEWTASIIDSLAWPTVVMCAGVFVFIRRTELTSCITKIKVGDFECEFNKQVNEISEELQGLSKLDELPPETNEDKESFNELAEKVKAVASVSPESAVSLAWGELEREINMASHRLGMQAKTRKFISQSSCFNYMLNSDLLSQDEKRLMKKMRHLRNVAVHPFAGEEILTEKDALTYFDNTRLLIDRLSNLKSINHM